MGELDGGVVVARTAEQSGMARGCSGAALEKHATGRVRCLWLRSYAGEDERRCLFLFCGDILAKCGRILRQQAEHGCGASGGTDARILSLWRCHGCGTRL